MEKQQRVLTGITTSGMPHLGNLVGAVLPAIATFGASTPLSTAKVGTTALKAAGSGFAYGTGAGNAYCDENTKLNPISTYAKHKVLVEQELMHGQAPRCIK